MKEKIVVQLEKNLFTLKSYVQLDRKFNIGNENPNLLLSRIQTQPHAHEFMNFHLQNVQERKGDDHILCSDHPHLCTPTEPLHFFHDPDQREAIKAINQPSSEKANMPPSISLFSSSSSSGFSLSQWLPLLFTSSVTTSANSRHPPSSNVLW